MSRRYGRPVGNADSLSFMYYNDTRNRRNDADNRTGENNIFLYICTVRAFFVFIF